MSFVVNIDRPAPVIARGSNGKAALRRNCPTWTPASETQASCVDADGWNEPSRWHQTPSIVEMVEKLDDAEASLCAETERSSSCAIYENKKPACGAADLGNPEPRTL